MQCCVAAPPETTHVRKLTNLEQNAAPNAATPIPPQIMPMKTEIYRRSSGFPKPLKKPASPAVKAVKGIAKEDGGSDMQMGPFTGFVGVSAIKNARAYMEDFYDLCFHAERKAEGNSETMPIHYFAVFDGHGGTKTSRHLSRELIENVVQTPAFSEGKLGEAIEVGFAATDSHLALQAKAATGVDDGACACTVWLRGDCLIVANVGDSRAVLSSGGKAVPLSNDHKPNRPDERRRILSHGGFVQTLGVPRVNGVLAVSRAFGDCTLKPYITAAPEIAEVELGSVGEDEFVLVASDGLWDVFSNQEAVDFVANMYKKEKTWEAAAKALTTKAQSKGSGDNTTVVIVSLDMRTIMDA